jgi:hypothetical protein
MRVLKGIGKVVLILAGLACLALLVSLAVNYRPSAVMGQRVDPGAINALEGDPVRLADFGGRVVLLAFGTSG